MKRMSAPDRFWKKVARGSDDECWEWLGAKTQTGYGLFYASAGAGMMRAHRFSWEEKNGSIPNGLFVCHHCDNPACVNPRHLFVGTQAENMSDMKRKGRGRGPSRPVDWRPGAKLTRESVLLIREQIAAGVPQRAVGARFGISQSAVSHIARGISWGGL